LPILLIKTLDFKNKTKTRKVLPKTEESNSDIVYDRLAFFSRQPLNGTFVISKMNFIFKPEWATPEAKAFLRRIPNEPLKSKVIRSSP
jgi:hypothetical protein